MHQKTRVKISLTAVLNIGAFSFDEVLLFNRLDHLVDLCTSNLHLVPPAPAQCGVARPCHTSNIQTVRFCSYGGPWLIQPGSQGISCEENGLMSRRRLA